MKIVMFLFLSLFLAACSDDDGDDLGASPEEVQRLENRGNLLLANIRQSTSTLKTLGVDLQADSYVSTSQISEPDRILITSELKLLMEDIYELKGILRHPQIKIEFIGKSYSKSEILDQLDQDLFECRQLYDKYRE